MIGAGAIVQPFLSGTQESMRQATSRTPPWLSLMGWGQAIPEGHQFTSISAEGLTSSHE
jgi:hypothetical protein